MVAQLAGFAVAPMVRAPYVLPAWNATRAPVPPILSRFFSQPVWNNSAGLDGGGVPTNIAVGAFRPTGLSTLTLAPTVAGTSNFNVIGGGKRWGVISTGPKTIYTGVIPDTVSGAAFNPGDAYPYNVLNTYAFTSYPFETSEMQGSASKTFGSLFERATSTNAYRLTRWNGSALLDVDAFNVAPFATSGGNSWFNGVTMFASIVVGNWNYAYRNVGTLPANPGNIWFKFPVVNSYTVLDSGVYLPVFQPVTFDNPVLNACVGDTAKFSVTNGGDKFIGVFRTLGAGPTGQVCEIAIIEPDFSAYRLVRLAPQDLVSVAALSQTVGLASPWSVKFYDGVLYITTGVVTDNFVYISGALSGGIVTTTGIPPYSLPCFATCLPVDPQAKQ